MLSLIFLTFAQIPPLPQIPQLPLPQFPQLPFQQPRETFTVKASETVLVEPDQGRIIATINVQNLYDVMDSLEKINIKDKDIRVLLNEFKAHYRKIEIYGGVKHRGDASVRDGKISLAKLHVTVSDSKKLQEAIEAVIAGRGNIHSAGFVSSKENEAMEEAKNAAIEKAKKQLVVFQNLLDKKIRIVGIDVDFPSDRSSPVPGVSISITCNVKLTLQSE